MGIQFVTCFIAIAAGLAFSGAIASLWLAFYDERPHLGLLQEGGPYAPLKGLVLAFSAPTNLIFAGADTISDGVVEGALYMLAGMALSLLQGVAILAVLG